MYDIAFISYKEKNANNNFLKLLSHILPKNNRIFRIENVEGIHLAHIEAAKQVNTPMFYVVDADAKLLPNFKFDITLDPSEEDIVHVWRSINPINYLEYGYGGVKLLPRNLTLNMDTTNPDMTTSISSRFKAMEEVSNITAFNTDPLSTWRSAFRECAKLASRTILGQLDNETAHRLNVWTHIGGDKPFGEYAKGGASAGEWFGKTYKDNKEMLAKINDYEWLASEFYGHIEMFPPATFKGDWPLEEKSQQSL
jgi:hypothetical protein